MKFRSIAFFAGLALLVAQSACTPATTETVTLQAQCEATGPFFSGPNSLMANYEPNLEELLGKEGIKQENITAAKVKSVEVSLSEGSDVDLEMINSASLQMVSDDLEMVGVAVQNPVDPSQGTLALQVSNEVELKPFFKVSSFTFVLDLDLKEDAYVDALSANVEVTLDVSYKN